MAVDYKQAGVDVAAGDALVDWLQSTQKPSFPHKDKLVAGIGGFAALFRADFSGLKEPCLVSCTDGVGTKVKLASHFKSYREVAQDLVAMCVNDLVCSGARPLFFLDYYATGHLELEAAKEFLASVRDACHESECALIGGETAEMPGVYQKGDFDCAGFAVGVVDRSKAWGPERVRVGDRLIGVASSGFHSNGFSLLRRLFSADLDQWREVLLRPTALYVRLCLSLAHLNGVKAAAHITGGGLENLPRVLPKGTRALLDPWPIPPEFHEVQRRSQMAWSELVRTLNCGLGFVFIVAPDQTESVLRLSQEHGFQAFALGDVVAHEGEPDWQLRPGRQWGTST